MHSKKILEACRLTASKIAPSQHAFLRKSPQYALGTPRIDERGAGGSGEGLEGVVRMVPDAYIPPQPEGGKKPLQRARDEAHGRIPNALDQDMRAN